MVQSMTEYFFNMKQFLRFNNGIDTILLSIVICHFQKEKKMEVKCVSIDYFVLVLVVHFDCIYILTRATSYDKRK